MSAEQLKRLYGFSDPVAVQVMRVFAALITRDLAFFTAYDPDFTMDFINGFIALIDAAESTEDYEFLMDQLAILTTELNAKMELGRKTYRFMKPFIEKAFPDRPDIGNLFGADDYHDARNNQEKLPAFLTKVHFAAEKYKDPLIAAGFLQENIDKIKTVKDDIVRANVEQDDFKLLMKEKIKDRIQKMNTAWKVSLRINSVGKTIFEDDYSKYRQYVIYHSSTPGAPEILNGSVPAGQTVAVMSDVTPATVLKLKNPGTTGLEYCLAETPEPCTSGIELNPGDEHETSASEMGDGTILKVTNKSDTEDGQYEVEVS